MGEIRFRGLSEGTGAIRDALLAEPGDFHVTAQAVESIKAARTSYDIFKTLKAFGPRFGLDRFLVYATHDDGSAALDDRFVLTNWDSEAIHRAKENDFLRWPYANGLRESVLPRSVTFKDALDSDEEMENRGLAEFLLAHGFNAFACLPTRSSNGITGAVSFSGMRDRVRVDELLHLNFVAEYAFEKLMQIVGNPGSPENPLSEREIECLKAAAHGLSVAETAERIGITTHTVNYHLANAQKKLTARNKLHAVVSAMQRSWLGHH